MSDCQALDPCRCPLCGGPNRCAMAQPGPSAHPHPQAHAQAHTPCWCTRELFSAQLLQRLPEAARGRACICPDCVKASQATP